MIDKVVRTIKAPVLVILGERFDLAVFFQAADLAITMLGKDEAPFAVESQTVRPWFTATPGFPGISTRVKELGGAQAWIPAEDNILRNVREKQITAAFHPDRSLGPFESSREFFDHGIRRQ